MDTRIFNRYYKDMVCPKLLHQLLSYDKSTGNLFWKERGEDLFKNPKHPASTWNNRYAGKRADRKGNKAGYLRVSIFGKKYYAHRVVWALQYGRWPDEKDHIDHIDKNKTNNKVENLRCVSASHNHRNTKRQANNTSGQTGVCWVSARKKWMAYIKVKQKTKNLGYFSCFEEAKKVRLAAQEEHGFLKTHGGSK